MFKNFTRLLKESAQLTKESYSVGIKQPKLMLLVSVLLIGVILTSLISTLLPLNIENTPLLLGSIFLSSILAESIAFLIIGKLITTSMNYGAFLKKHVRSILLLALISSAIQLPSILLFAPASQSLPEINVNFDETYVSTPILVADGVSTLVNLIANIIPFLWFTLAIFMPIILVLENTNFLSAFRYSVNLAMSKLIVKVCIAISYIAVIFFIPMILLVLLLAALYLMGPQTSALLSVLLFGGFFALALLVLVMFFALVYFGVISVYLAYKKVRSKKAEFVPDERSIQVEHNATWYTAVVTFLVLLSTASLQLTGIIKIEPDWLIYVLIVVILIIFALAYMRANNELN